MRYFFLFLSVFFISCKQENPYFAAARQNDHKKLPSRGGDWLLSHPEKFVSYEDFIEKYKPIDSTTAQVICIQPVGFSQVHFNPDFHKCATYLSLFFQKNVRINNSQKLVPNSQNSRTGYDLELQLNAKFINDTLLTQSPFTNYIATMALTQNDIYPGNDWIYVFGLANYANRVGITSTYRFKSEDPKVAFSRLIKVASHETAHMFGLTHCVRNECLMNGCNHIVELDRNSLRLCSLCQQKLAYRLRINPEKRSLDLQKFFIENNFPEVAKLLAKDCGL